LCRVHPVQVTAQQLCPSPKLQLFLSVA
jgi:hypothetical protein